MMSEYFSIETQIRHTMDSRKATIDFQLRSLLVMLAVLGLSSGCFITNCPPGGKRFDSALERIPIRQCSRCGYGGRCFGPAICCSPTSGCLIADNSNTHSLLRPCAIEATMPGVCVSGSKPCGRNGGRCASNGLCCDNVSCSTDASCRASSLVMDSSYLKRIRGNVFEDLPSMKDYTEEYRGFDAGLGKF